MTATTTFAGAAPDAAVHWHAIPWRKVFRKVRRLQVRPLAADDLAAGRQVVAGKAIQHGRWGKVQALVHLLTHSFSGRACAVLRVTENSGKKTPGVDGEVWDDPEQKAHALHTWRRRGYQAQPLRRVYPKGHISHDWLLTHIPMDQVILQQGLQAGYLEAEAFHSTETGTPQGGIISPALANRGLDGLQAELQRHINATPRQTRQTKVHLVRYADDFVITGSSRELLADQVLPVVQRFRSGRGLELSRDQTKITAVADGFAFLGQQVRRFGRKLLVRPTKVKVRALLDKVRDTSGRSGAWTAGELFQQLNPLLRGWTLYHRHAHRSHTFASVDRVLRNCW